MWKKNISLLLMFLGVIVVLFNFYSLNKGFSVYSKPNISTNDFQLEEETPAREAGGSKDLSLREKSTPEIGEKIGELTIPKLERSLPIYHGTTKEVLKQGVGHYSSSALPGENNNSILSGHRDTVFRGLGEVGVNDTFIVSTDAGEFLYKVRKVRIVDKDDRTVIVPKPKSTLTVTTCYPFGYIGSAPQRYVLVADLISQNH
jgi:sortase A